MAKNETQEERQRREREERIELLKLKQGLIEKSELIQSEAHNKPEKLHGAARVKNEIYHLGWALPMVIVAVALVVFIIVQLANRPKEDLRVLIISVSESSELFKFSESADSVKAAFEKYCADYDGNGKVYVSTVYIDLSDISDDIQYRDTQYNKFSIEVNSGTAMLILADPELDVNISELDESSVSAFTDLTDKLPVDKLYNSRGARITGTEFARDIGVENAVLLVRNDLGNGAKKNSAQYRDRAVEVLKNILSGD